MGRTGETLRAARLAKQVSLQQVEKETKIKLKHLEALESGQFANLPAPVYARAYLRTYAQYLGLDPAPLLRSFNEECDVKEPRGVQSEVKVRGGGPVVTPGPFIAVGIVTLVVVAAFYLYQQYSLFVGNWSSGSGADGGLTMMATPEPTQAVVIQPTATPAPTATPTPRTDVTIEVKVIQRCWFRVVVDGAEVYQGTLEAGDSRSWTGKDKIWMRAGNPSGVEVVFNGKPQGRLAPAGSGPLNIEWSTSQVPGH